jgi:Galactose oxidase, central domain
MPHALAAPRPSVLAVVILAAPLFAQANWTSLSPGTTPSGRFGHAMAYDLANDRVVLFGGSDGVNRLNDTWLFDGTSWAQASPTTSPPARAGHPLAYDLGRGRVVLFGGVSTVTLGDTWEWDGQNWLAMTPATQPPARRSQPMIYYPPRGTVVMWGGYNGVQDVNDMWEWNGTDWAPIVTLTSPAPRRASEMAYDVKGGGIVLFSGYLQGADTWYFDGLDWSQQQPAHVPPARYDHTMSTDLLRNRVVMFGGTAVADTWEWDGSDWLQRQPATLPPARYDDYMVYDWIRNRTLMFGGLVGNPDLWQYDSPNPGTFQPFGSGCAGTNGSAPQVGASDVPWIGETFQLNVDQLPAVNSLALLVAGFSNTQWSLGALPYGLGAFGMPGCQLLTAPAASFVLVTNSGNAAWHLPIPNQLALAGVHFFAQAAALDPGANPLGATVSNGGSCQIGAK